jgi:predicted secreted hydrolase
MMRIFFSSRRPIEVLKGLLAPNLLLPFWWPPCLFILCLLCPKLATGQDLHPSPQQAPQHSPRFAAVLPGQPLSFPRDFGAHPEFRTEWWYVTGWLRTPSGQDLGFQVTFFRSKTAHDERNPSRFAPKQLIIAHAALSDPQLGKLQHDQKIARSGLGLASADTADTRLQLHQWRMQRLPDGHYEITLPAREFSFKLSLSPTQAPLLQGDQGYSRKGPNAEQASYYYSEPQLKVSGSVERAGKVLAVSGDAWLDHEWSSSVLDGRAVGWDWVGANLKDGGALMAFRIRGADGQTLWQAASLRDGQGHTRHFTGSQILFRPQRVWRSPRTQAQYPVAMNLEFDGNTWQLQPLQDDQELDSRLSTGAVYWEGAVRLQRDGQTLGRGYFEMTGYYKALKL